MTTEYKEALEIVCKELRSDTELRHAFTDNVAMAFVDNCHWYKQRKQKKVLSNRDIRAVANDAAIHFIGLLINK